MFKRENEFEVNCLQITFRVPDVSPVVEQSEIQ